MTRPITAGRVLLAGALLVSLVRVASAVRGSTPGSSVAIELGALWLTASVVALMVRDFRRPGVKEALVCGVTLVVMGLGVVAPMWRIAHPSAALYEGRLGGGEREVRTPPARVDGWHVLEIEAPAGARYLMQVDVEQEPRWIDSQKRLALFLERSQQTTLFVEQSTADLAVRLRPVGVPWTWVLLAAVAAVVLAVWADALYIRRRARGALAALVGGAAAFSLMIGPDGGADAGQVAGAAALAPLAGLLVGAVAVAVAGVRARGRRSGPRPATM